MAKRSVQVEIFAAGDGINYPQKVSTLDTMLNRCLFAVLDLSGDALTDLLSPAFASAAVHRQTC